MHLSVRNQQVNWKPNKYVAALLGFFAMPLGMLYVGRPLLSAAYFGSAIAFAILDYMLLYKLLPPNATTLLMLALPTACSCHAYRVTEQANEATPKPWYAKWYGLAFGFVIVFAVLGGFRAFLLEPFRAPSSSMLPSVRPGASLLVQKWGYGNYQAFGIRFARADISEQLKRGDAIVFEYPSDRKVTFLSRVVGLPGDKVTYQAKRLSINGQLVAQQALPDYLHQPQLYYSLRFKEMLDKAEYEVLVQKEAPATISPDLYEFRDKCHYEASGVSCSVPEGRYFVLSDNRDAARDSRIWGFVPAEYVIGRVIHVSQ